MRVGNHLDPVGEVVEDEKGIGDHEEDIGKIQALFFPRRQFLEITDHVVSHESHGAAEKTGQRRVRHRLVVGEHVLDDLERIPFKGQLFRPAVP